MNEDNPLLKIRFDGDAVGPGKIPVSHLLRFLSNLNKALQRTGRVLQGDADSVRRGQPPHNIKEEVELDLVSLTPGSSAAVLGFERRQKSLSLAEMDFGLEILEKSIDGLEAVQKDDADEALPNGYDTGVLMAWRDAGMLFSQGIDKIEFTLNHREKAVQTSFAPNGVTRIQERIRGPQVNIRTIEGRLLMADFKEHGTRCRVHPSAGDPVLCLFDEGQKDEVLESILQYVRIVGEAKEDPISQKITDIKIHDIERLEDRQDEAADLLPKGTPISRAFWESPTLEELARSQNVQPMADVRALFGTWPGEENDGFETAIDELRHPGAEKSNWGEKKRKKLETTLRNFVVIPYDHEIARCYGRLVAERQRNGNPIPPNDAWIAACTVRHTVPLVTHNAKDFEGITALQRYYGACPDNRIDV